MITDVPGVRVGHHSDEAGRTGCTVVLFDEPPVAAGEVRGSAPATREFALLDPSATVERIDAVVLSGGSAFGLAAADGVVGWLEEHDRGVPTTWGRVPIVVGMSLFDLPVGDPRARPSAADGRAAARAAGAGPPATGAVGAGTGATVSSWRGIEGRAPGGVVSASVTDGELVVAVLVAVNAWGDIEGSPGAAAPEPRIEDAATLGNTTIGVVATNGDLGTTGCLHLARGAHDGLARAVSPPHGTLDGDAFVAVATGAVTTGVDRARWMAVRATEAAIRSAGAWDVPR